MSTTTAGVKAPEIITATATAAAMPVLLAISVSHLLNDVIQSLLPAIYPILKGGFNLSFVQIGLLTMTFQITGSLLQPLVGSYTDRRPQPYSLPVGMAASLAGLLTLAFAPDYAALLAGSAMLGVGSSIFHPEASRIARQASGGAHGLAQSVFQVGGNFGTALGPLAAAFIVLPQGRTSLAWFALAALGGIIILTRLGRWYRANSVARRPGRSAATAHPTLTGRQVKWALAALVALVFSKYVYMASFTNYYVFYLMHRFHLSTQAAQVDLFVFFGAVAAGTIIGGPVGDRIGRKTVIWGSILGVLPFALVLPWVGLAATVALSAVIGMVLASAFPAIVVFAQELMPGRVGMISGMFFGLAFGISGIAAALLGGLADHPGIEFVYRLCSFLPLLGLFAAFLPNLKSHRA